MSLNTILLIIYLFGGIIFYAIDYKIGVIMHFVMGMGLWMLFYSLDWNWSTMLVINLMFLVIMSLSLLFVGGANQKGGVV